MASRVFDSESQIKFASLSGDCNPIHVSALEARRTQAGAPVVHGIHSLLYLLEAIIQDEPRLPRATGFKVRFRNPIYVGEEFCVRISSRKAATIVACIIVDDIETVSLRLYLGQRKSTEPPLRSFPSALSTTLAKVPHELPIELMRDRTGSLDFGPKVADIQKMFPVAAGYLGSNRVAALVCCSYLVGMVIPGLYSLFCGLDLSLIDEERLLTNDLSYCVESVDSRFGFVRVDICGAGLNGRLETMNRPPPMRQPSMTDVQSLVSHDEFRGSTALIVGGSRGLGELTAKLVAAGGGRVVITYSTGKADADAVAAEIQQSGATCTTMPYDIGRAAHIQLAGLGTTVPSHLYYFATPSIFRRKAGICDLKRFAEFGLYYVEGFLQLVLACLHKRPEGVSVFYPSTVFIDARPANMTEYAMAKAAGEILCADMEEYLPGARVIVRRLPRLPTDQTSTVAPIESVDAIGTMLRIVRDMHSNS